MSHPHETLATLQLPAAAAITWFKGSGSRFSLIPILAALDCNCRISDAIQPVPVAYGRLKVRPVPLVMPGPHRLGVTQVDTPFGTTFQPLLASRLLAWPGSYGNGSPCLPLAESHEVTGALPTGPTVRFPYPRSGPDSTAAWFIMYASASRKYSCLMIAAGSETEDWKFPPVYLFPPTAHGAPTYPLTP